MARLISRPGVVRIGLLAFFVALVCVALAPVAAHAATPTYISSDWSGTTRFPVTWWGPGQQGIPTTATIDVQYKVGADGPWTNWVTNTTTTLGYFPGTYGKTYWFRTRWETADRTSLWSPTIAYAVPFDHVSATYSRGSWSTLAVRGGYAYNNSVRYSTRYGASMTFRFTGKRVALIATKGRGRGKFAVYLDGSTRAYRTIETYSSVTKYRRNVFDYTFKTDGPHTIVLRNLATRGRPRVEIDALAVVRPDVKAPVNASITAPDYTNDSNLAFSLEASDSVGVDHVTFSIEPSILATTTLPMSAWRDSYYRAVLTTDAPLGSAEEVKTIVARFYDEAGNVAGPVTKNVVLDTTAPIIDVTPVVTPEYGAAASVEATLTEANPVAVSLLYKSPGDSAYATATMSPVAAGSKRYSAEIPAAETTSNLEYRVVATDAAGNVATPSNGLADIAPRAPGSLGVTPGDRSVGLTWNASPDSDVTLYRVYRDDTGNGAWKQIAETAGLGLTDTTDVLNNRTYRYRVAAVDARTESTPTAPQQAVLPQKLGSLGIDVVPSATIGASFPATITATDDNGDPYTAGADLSLSSNPQAFSPVNFTLPAATSQVTTSLASAVSGEVAVTVTRGLLSATDTITIGVVPAPTGLGATLGDGKVTLTWNASTNQDVTGYKVYRATATTPTALVASIAATPSPTFIDTVRNGDVYTYSVTAVGPAGFESTAATTTADLPQKLASLQVTASPATVTVGATFTVSVTAKDQYGAPYLEGITTVTVGGTGPGSVAPTSLAIPVGQQSANGQFTYSAVATVTLTASATDPVGKGTVSGNFGPLVVRDVPAPTGLAATPGDGKVTLKWNASTNPDVTGYKIYRATATTSSALVASIATTPSPTYVDTVPNGDVYTYRVTAVGPGGRESAAATTTADLPQKLAKLEVSASPAAVTVGATFTVTVTAKDQYDKPYLEGITTVTVGASGTGSLSPASLAIPVGSPSGNRQFTYTADGSITLTASAKDPVAGQTISGTTTITVGVVPTPANLVAVPGDGSVRLTWDAATSGDVTGYKIYRATAATPSAEVASIAATSSPTYVDTVLNGDVYTYTVKAVGPGGLLSAAATAVADLPQKLASLEVSAPTTATVGVPFSVTVTAKDEYGDPYLEGLAMTVAATPGPENLSPTSLAIDPGSSSVLGELAYAAEGSVTLTFSATDIVTGVPIEVSTTEPIVVTLAP